MLVRLHACGVCHTDLYSASGADPSGYAACVLGQEGAGVGESVGEGVDSLRPGDHVVTLFSSHCGKCVNCRSGKTNICVAIGERQNAGYLPDGTTRLSRERESLRHFMGCSTFVRGDVMPEIALAKVSEAAPFEAACLFACGLCSARSAGPARSEPRRQLRPQSLAGRAKGHSAAFASKTSGRPECRTGMLAVRCRWYLDAPDWL